MRILSFAVITFSLALFFSACQKKSTAPIIPAITFKDFIITDTANATLEVNFTDGDGDIGYSSQDASAPPNFWIRYLYYNYTDKQYEGVYNPLDTSTFDSVYFVYNIPDLTPKGKNKSLTGIIKVAMSPVWYIDAYTSHTDSNHIEYQVWLFDRAGHKSNVVTVGPINVD